MLLDITTKGHISVLRDGGLVSKHNIETEAIESCVRHASEHGSGKYIFTYPNKEVVITLPTAEPKETGIITGNAEIA